MRDFLFKYKYLVVALLLTLLNLFLLWIFFGFQSDVDSGGYLETIKALLAGDRDFLSLLPHRILRPGGVFLALPLAKFLSPFAALSLENIIFYFFSAYLVYRIAREILDNKSLAVLSVVFFITTYPMLRFGPIALTDMGAWFFYLLSIYLTILFLKNPKSWLVCLNGLACGIGVLFKESGGMGILFFVLALLLTRRYSYQQILSWLAKFLLFFLLPITLNQSVVYYYFHYSYLNWYVYNSLTYLKSSYTIFNLAKNFFILFGLGWVFFLIGCWRLWRQRVNDNKFYLYLALLGPSLSFLLWPDLTARLMFISGLLFCLVAVKGFMYFLQSKSKILSVILLLSTIMLNYILVWLSYLV